MSYAAAIASAATSSPMSNGTVPIIPNRVLYIDGDGLAYYCAGNDTTEAGEARENAINKIRSHQRACGAERAVVLLTSSGSIKGHRYAIARVKPYQGQRVNSRRPKNWPFLREFLESAQHHLFEVEATATAEADDLFGYYGWLSPQDSVICTQDKDMRMVPGWHLEWTTNVMHYVPPETMCMVRNDKVYGEKWFWLQMLHGDTADYIPGLPKYKVHLTESLKPVGEVTANKLLSGTAYPYGSYASEVAHWYHSYYGERWLVEMLEQACLLWMRREPNRWDDCALPGGPMARFVSNPSWPAAYSEIKQRVLDADTINAASQANSEVSSTMA